MYPTSPDSPANPGRPSSPDWTHTQLVAPTNGRAHRRLTCPEIGEKFRANWPRRREKRVEADRDRAGQAHVPIRIHSPISRPPPKTGTSFFPRSPGSPRLSPQPQPLHRTKHHLRSLLPCPFSHHRHNGLQELHPGSPLAIGPPDGGAGCSAAHPRRRRPELGEASPSCRCRSRAAGSWSPDH